MSSRAPSPRGGSRRIDDADGAARFRACLQVFTHENRPARRLARHELQTTRSPPPGSPFRAALRRRDHVQRQPSRWSSPRRSSWRAHARHRSSGVEYEREPHDTDIEEQRAEAYEPKREALRLRAAEAARRRRRRPSPTAAGEVSTAEYHLPDRASQPDGAVCDDGGLGRRRQAHRLRQDPGRAERAETTSATSSASRRTNVRVLSPFVGGAFGSGLRPQYQRVPGRPRRAELERSVRVVLTRQQMFSLGHRPDDDPARRARRRRRRQARRRSSTRRSRRPRASRTTSENVVNWSGLLYAVRQRPARSQVAQLDLYTPCDMRAPGAASGDVRARVAMDELAVRREDRSARASAEELYGEGRRTRTSRSRARRSARATAEGAERFGWARRNPRAALDARRRRAGRLGHGGPASGKPHAVKTAAQVRVLPPTAGSTVASATADIGTGTYTS